MTDNDLVINLVNKLKKYNKSYRSGTPLVSDSEYDILVEQLRELSPDNPFLNTVEPESFVSKKEIRHPIPMLSIEKSYDSDSLEKFIRRVKKEAEEIGINTISFKVTPKLDGLAGRDDGTIFASRGNGETGYEISSAFAKGIIPTGGRGGGIGEIVIKKSYFEKNLGDKFEHPRNMVVGIIASDKLNEHAKKAIADGVVKFVPYSELPFWQGSGTDLLSGMDFITEDLTKKTDYPLDGMVAAVTDEIVKQYMGATSHHYRWQIAIKKKGETAVTRVKDIIWQVGRTGSITPVLAIEPTCLSGATIRRVTAHNAGLIKKKEIGIGSEIEIIRSGEVIPKLEKVIEKTIAVIPDKCPACENSLRWDNDFLKCDNKQCVAQIEQGIIHWFKILGNTDWFGNKTIRKLVGGGYDSLEKIYAMVENDFTVMGFGPVQSKNLFQAIQVSLSKQVEDWRFLAAFGILNLGKGDSRKLLSSVPLSRITELTEDEITKIHGFGELTARSITAGIVETEQTIQHMLTLGFNLTQTPLESETTNRNNPISGRSIVFTGKMNSGSREEMKATARLLGAKVQSAVSGKTDFLVCGEKTGAGKINKAKNAGTEIVTETEYLEMIK